MAESNLIQIATDSNFPSDVLGSQGLCIVDFWAAWCGPCLMLAPTIAKLAEERAGTVKVFKMNVDENPETPAKFSIRGIPTVLFFKGGKPVDQLVGNHPKAAFDEVISRHI